MAAFLFIHNSRRVRRLVIFAVCALVLIVGAVSVAYAATRWSNGQAASIVQGQPNFITNTIGSTADKMNTPYGVAVDPATGKLFVADINNSRVLRFSSANALISGSAAEAVLGQADFTGTSCNRGGAPADNTLCYPWAVWVDSGRRFWVSDTSNNRVLRFDNGATIASGSSANVVLGQSDFVSTNSAVAPNRMDGPYGLFVDSAGRLWVSDRWSGRVLRFDSAAAKANGANADGVLGAPNFTTSNSSCGTPPAPVQNNMCGPAGVVGDGVGNLFVADLPYNRVLRFNRRYPK